MKKYLYFCFIIYIGLLVSNLVIYTLRIYVESGSLYMSKHIFLEPQIARLLIRACISLKIDKLNEVIHENLIKQN